MLNNCLKCNSVSIVKYGVLTLKNSEKVQRWYCKDCKRAFSEKPSRQLLTEENKGMIDKLLAEGVGYRKIQRILGLKSHQVVMNYLKKKLKN